ncbi:MAG: hypothetical protein KY476_14710 [Planctomycetes bacterium]|nr:hypothetical protein [Planctomycetota bacterium]
MWILLVSGSLPCVAAAADQTSSNAGPAPLVAGILARGDAVSSGRMKYSVESGFRNRRPHSVIHVHFSFEADSWARRQGKSTRPMPLRSARVSHQGKYVEYVQHPQPDGTYHHTAHIYHSRKMAETLPYPPYFAGSVWFRSTLEYIRDNADSAALIGEEVIDGIPTRVLEWKVSQEDVYGAFFAIDNTWANGGSLRLYVAPQLGFVLPRIEQIRKAGQVACRYTAGDFKEHAPGIFIPGRADRQWIRPDGTQGHFISYEITAVNFLNRDVPDDDFIVIMPPDTRVQDTRPPGGGTFFEAGSPPPEIELELRDIIAVEKRGESDGEQRRNRS